MNLLYLYFILITQSNDVLVENFLQKYALKETVLIYLEDSIAIKGHVIYGELVDTIKIYRLDEYLKEIRDSLVLDMTKRYIYDTLKLISARFKGAGLIPDIELPPIKKGARGLLGGKSTLKIDGRQSITFAGEKTFEKNVYYGEYGNPSLLPELHMEQTLKVKVGGTIGEKIKVTLDHDSERETEIKNKVNIKYEGDEDEIVKLIEAGDTRLVLPNTRYTGYSQVNEGLFGLKTEFQIGGLKIVSIASREQGKTETKTFSPEARVETTIVYDDQYVKYKFFYIGETDSIVEIEVFVDDKNGMNDSISGAISGYAYIDPSNPSDTTPVYEYGKFNKLVQGQDYYFYPGSNMIEFLTNVEDYYVIGVYYKTVSGRVVGKIDTVPIILKLIKPQNFPREIDPNSSDPDEQKWALLWSYHLKNAYYIGSSVMPQSLIIRIYKDDPSGIDPDGERGKTYIQLLGLDPDGDGIIKENIIVNGKPFTVFDYQRGILFFPELYPFASDSLSDPDSIIYWRTSLYPNEGKKYYIKAIYKERMDVISLGQMNLIPNSEVVKVNGVVLQRGVDYDIDYDLGIITFKKELQPTDKIEITFKYAPFMAVKQRSLVGTRFEYAFEDSILVLGSSWLMRSEGTSEWRPRLGEEPTRIILGDVDAAFSYQPMFITKFLNKIPFIETDAPSNLKISSELALSFPNPNTRNDAYLDDFESTEISTDLSITRTSWFYGSLPEGRDTSEYVKKIIWASPPDLVKNEDINPNVPEEEKERTRTVLLLIPVLNPEGPSSQIFSLNQLIDRTGEDISDRSFIEVLIKGENAKLHIDLGEHIPEDAIWRDKNGKIRGLDTLNTEDKNLDGRLDVGEDTGIDGVEGDDDKWTSNSKDAGNDDYYYDYKTRDYSKINGTEKNNKLDTEDLNFDNLLETRNDYFEYTIDLNDTLYLVETSPKGWKRYRIPLKDTSAYEIFGNPSFERIVYARIWFSDVSQNDTFMIASIKIVGNVWQKGKIVSSDSLNYPVYNDEIVGVSVVGNDLNPNYTPPPGIKLHRDPTTGRLEYEHSIALVYNNIRPFHKACIYKRLLSEENLLNYRKIKFWVKKYSGDNVKLLFRFGGDSLNFYQYSFNLTDNEWHEVEVDFKKLTSFKYKKINSSDFSTDTLYVEGNYGFMGNPNLGSIKYYEFAVYNEDTVSPISGEIWIDELRVSEPRTATGKAFATTLNFNAADLIYFNFSFEEVEANFQKIGEFKPNYNTVKNLSWNTTFNFHKFFPNSWGINLPLNFSQNKSFIYPVYLPGNDIELEKKESERKLEISESKNFSASFSKGRSGIGLLRFLLDPWHFSYLLSSTSNRRNLGYDTTFTANFNSNYNYTIPWKPIRIGKLQIRPWIYNFGFGFGLSKSFTYSKDYVSGTSIRKLERYFTYKYNFSVQPINNMNASYSADFTNDLELKKEKFFGDEIMRNERINASYFVRIGQLFPNLNLNYNTNYSEDHRPETRINDSLNLRNVILNSSVSLNTAFNLPYFFKLISSLRDESKDTLVEKGSPQWLLIQLEKFSNFFQTLNLNLSYSKNLSHNKLRGRPNWRYRYGFQDTVKVEKFDDPNDRRSYTFSLNGNTGMDIWLFSLGFKGSFNRTLTFSPSGNTYSKSKTFPGVDITFYNLQNYISPLKEVFRSLNISSSYSKTYNVNGQMEEKNPDQENFTESYQPFISVDVRFINDVSLNLSLRKSKTKRLNYILENIIESYDFSDGWSLSISYVFSNPQGFKIPGFGGRIFRFQNQLKVTFKMDKSRNKTVENGIIYTDTENQSFSLNFDYTFSKSVTGNGSISYNVYRDRKSNIERGTVGVSVGAVFEF